MSGKGRPTKAEAIAKAWKTIHAAAGNGSLDIKAVLAAIATDSSAPATARVSAVRALRDIEISEENRRLASEAGL